MTVQCSQISAESLQVECVCLCVCVCVMSLKECVCEG